MDYLKKLWTHCSMWVFLHRKRFGKNNVILSDIRKPADNVFYSGKWLGKHMEKKSLDFTSDVHKLIIKVISGLHWQAAVQTFCIVPPCCEILPRCWFLLLFPFPKDFSLHFFHCCFATLLTWVTIWGMLCSCCKNRCFYSFGGRKLEKKLVLCFYLLWEF